MHVSVICRPGWAAAADLWPPLGLLSTVRHFAFACCFCLLLWQHLHLHSTTSIEKLRIRAVYISNLLDLNSYRKFFYTCRKFKISYSTCNIVVSMGNCFSKHEYLSGKKMPPWLFGSVFCICLPWENPIATSTDSQQRETFVLITNMQFCFYGTETIKKNFQYTYKIS